MEPEKEALSDYCPVQLAATHIGLHTGLGWAAPASGQALSLGFRV